MASYSPTITFYAEGIYTISSNDGTPYFMTQNSMGSYLYGLNLIYYQANTKQQVLQGLKFRSYDVNGTINSFLDVTTISPYQYQNSLFFKPIRNDIVFDGRTSITFELLANENVNFVFYVTEISNGMFLKDTNFFDENFFKQKYGCFDDTVEKN
jgi:hypothetical protein